MLRVCKHVPADSSVALSAHAPDRGEVVAPFQHDRRSALCMGVQLTGAQHDYRWNRTELMSFRHSLASVPWHGPAGGQRCGPACY
jgi:hypothetical protein